MREIGTETTVGHCSCDGVAVHTRRSLEDAAAFRDGVIANGRLLLLLDPLLELFRRIHINPQEHLGMLDAAILSALAKIESCLLRVDPGLIRVVRNQVRLSGQPWHPKTVIGIGRKKSEKRGCRLRRVADRHMQFVRCDHPQSRVTKLPPELMTDRGHYNGPRRLGSVLDGA